MHEDVSLIPLQDAPSASSQSQLGVPTNARERWPCPVTGCTKDFGRPQERDRHLLTYLPYWLFCPFPDCSWRGDRYNNLKNHWLIHANTSLCPRIEDCKIYEPAPLVQSIVRGESLIEVTATAISAVTSRAIELDKVGVWRDDWGHRRRVQH
jgi:hypothetical protein